MRIGTILLLVIGVFLLFTGGAAAQEAPITCADWFAIQGWNGTVTITGSGTTSDSSGLTTTINESATVTFKTDRSSAPCDLTQASNAFTGWSATGPNVTYSVDVHDQSTINSTDQSGHACVLTITDEVSGGTSSTKSGNVDMRFNGPTAGKFQIAESNTVDGVQETTSGCGVTKTVTTSTFWGAVGGSWPQNLVPLPSAIGPLTGTTTFQDSRAPAAPIAWTVSWNFTPSIDYDMYLVMDTDLDTWRPEAGSDENATGGFFSFHAEIIDKVTGQPASLVSADQWNFTLKDVSHEPGVSMNFPAANKVIKPSPPDLDFKFGNDIIYSNLEISDDGSSVLVKPDVATDSGLALLISSHDWGAWATLNATVRVAGQTINGHVEGDETTDILLPKRQTNSHIADAWKIAKGLALTVADDDDSETKPVGEADGIGDGLSLYEEYRGFMEKGKHIEGDPGKKDFFVQNLMGGDAEPGIRLFASTSGLVVHKDIQRNEMDKELHQINFNHGEGAQVVAQHGVVLANCGGTDGNVTIFTEAGVHGRPALTEGICIEPSTNEIFAHDALLSKFNTHRGAIRASSALTQFDIGVAHELAHSVGVNHHGEGDLGYAPFDLLGPTDPRNTTGQPVFMQNNSNTLVHLLDEATGTDRGAVIWDKLSKQIINDCGTVSALNDPSLFNANCQAFVNGGVIVFAHLGFYVGNKNAQHSGNDQCMMRYFFSNAFLKAGDPSTYYISVSGTEPTGTGLCPTRTGTGINAPGRTPQPRYFDATVGACKTWVCVNDKIPPQAN